MFLIIYKFTNLYIWWTILLSLLNSLILLILISSLLLLHPLFLSHTLQRREPITINIPSTLHYINWSLPTEHILTISTVSISIWSYPMKIPIFANTLLLLSLLFLNNHLLFSWIFSLIVIFTTILNILVQIFQQYFIFLFSVLKTQLFLLIQLIILVLTLLQLFLFYKTQFIFVVTGFINEILKLIVVFLLACVN